MKRTLIPRQEGTIRVMTVFGTRPEAIKMAPVVHECLRRNDVVEATVCLTGQHREMLTQVTEYFGIHEDLRLDVMTPNQTLSGLTARILERIQPVLRDARPDVVLV
jgi:UDP-N-acetylglucosamine 2-epimerase (non-hydrolysing)